MQVLEEALLEPVARFFRFSAGMAHIPKGTALKAADLGCGPKIRFYHAAKQSGVVFDTYYGVDPLLDDAVVKEYADTKDIKLVKEPLDDKISIPAQSLDLVVGFAFLEHIDNPKQIVVDSVRLLKPGGKAVFTTPSKTAKGVLEFLSYKLGVISKREIDEHKTYFDRAMLVSMVDPKIATVHHEYFEFGWNNLFVIERK